jgi:pilus assembly protein Flp/PilA
MTESQPPSTSEESIPEEAIIFPIIESPIIVFSSVARPTLKHLWNDETGQDLVEYALVAALIGLGGITAIRGLSTKIGTAFNTVGTNLSGNV